MRRCHTLPVVALMILIGIADAASQDRKFRYPPTEKVDVVDDYHGTKVADPYRWLEDDARTSTQVADWVAAQNAVTMPYLHGIGARKAIRARLEQLWDYERFSGPVKVAGTDYYFKNDGLQNQSVFYKVDAGANPTVVFDPNTWSQDGTVALSGLSISDDGRFIAYSKSTAGSDWRTWYVRDNMTGDDLPDQLHWTKFTGASWTLDGKGFFYSRFDEPRAGEEYQAVNQYNQLYYHRLGTPQSEDVLAYHRPDQPDWGFDGEVSEDGRYLILSVWKGTDSKNRLLVKDLAEPYGMPIDVIANFEHEFVFLGNDAGKFYFRTDADAPMKRVVAFDYREPAPENWMEVIPEAEQPLRSVQITGNLLVASYLKDAITHTRIFRLDGAHVRDVDFPGPGSVTGFGGKRSDFETFYTYTSINTPPSIYRYDLLSGRSELWQQAKVAADTSQYEVKQVFCHSKDGTRVPMFIAHRRGLRLDGERPTLLYGYGGFNIPLSPRFSVTQLAWMELDAVFVVANLRGGGEYGEKWHRAGTKLQKQNVFDDFVAAAEYLIEQGYTQPKKLAVQGGSNGGLLVGAAITQRPGLFGAALPAVGVMDMLRFHKFTAGRYWVDDYGSSENPEEFRALRAYSPYHNLERGTNYPATLITTADTDDRVVPGHSFKFAAALQEAHDGDSPVLIRIETSAGHGAGKPTSKRIDEAADLWAFLVDNLGVQLPARYGAGE